jgi:hypothetical protein
VSGRKRAGILAVLGAAPVLWAQPGLTVKITDVSGASRSIATTLAVTNSGSANAARVRMDTISLRVLTGAGSCCTTDVSGSTN